MQQQRIAQVQQQQQQQQLQNAGRANGALPPTSTNSPYQNASQPLPQGLTQQPQQRPFAMQQHPMAGSPFASAQLGQGQPGMRMGTPTMQTQMLPGTGLDGDHRKGKGKATDGTPLVGQKTLGSSSTSASSGGDGTV